MSQYQILLGCKSDFFEKLKNEIREAEKNFIVENNSATSIQRIFRGNRARLLINLQARAATEIERVFRGHLGRSRARQAATSKVDHRLLSIFNYLAIQLQKIFRGYYSKKYKHNFHIRKKYIKDLKDIGEKIREQQYQYASSQNMRETVEKEKAKLDEFKSYAENLHHLVSTKRTRGVFNPPEDYLQAPTMRNIKVEDHIRGAVKDLLRYRGFTKTGLVPDLHGSMKIPLHGEKNRLSIQASAPYDVVKKEKERAAHLHRILIRGKGNFTAGGKTDLLTKDADGSIPKPLCVGDPHMDTYRNPYAIRGVPNSTKQLHESVIAGKALFQLTPSRPFYTRADGNKSTTLPNNIFDVIAEAEETGGAAQRHLGTSTSRFGISQSMDNRPPEGNSTIPPPPLRTSTVKVAQIQQSRRKKRQAALSSQYHTTRSMYVVKSIESFETISLSVDDDVHHSQIPHHYDSDSSDD